MRSNVRIFKPRLHGRPCLHGRPLLDRIDIHMEVPHVAYDKLANATCGEPSDTIRARIGATRERQQQRLAGSRLA